VDLGVALREINSPADIRNIKMDLNYFMNPTNTDVNVKDSGTWSDSLENIKNRTSGILTFLHWNYVALALMKWHFQTRARIKQLRREGIKVAFHPFKGKSIILFPGCDFITMWHVELKPAQELGWNKLLIPMITEALKEFGLNIVPTEERDHSDKDIIMSGNDLEVNGMKFATIAHYISTKKPEYDSVYETLIITYDYDDELFRKCLPDKEYYKPTRGGWCDSPPGETEVDYTKKRITGLKQEFPNFDINLFRKNLCIKMGALLGSNLIMGYDTMKAFFDGECNELRTSENFAKNYDKIYRFIIP
jgi:hypothetical protein